MSTVSTTRLKIIFAFLAVYLVWGSTYLGILYAIETIPPWALTAMRFIVAGACMTAVAFFRREPALSFDQKKIAAISGVLLVLANGIVCVVEKWVPSGIAAVVIGAMPIWIMLIGWVSFGTGRPTIRKVIGATVGLVGIAFIAAGDTHSDSSGVFGEFAPFVLLISSWLWATGTLIQRRVVNLKSGVSFLSWQMMSGALIAFLLSSALESPWSYDWSGVTTKSWLALAYLVVFGSLIGFSAYSWLSRNVEPHLVSTYALVNPVIAVLLGWLWAGEELTAKFISSTILVLIGLGLLMIQPKAKSSSAD